MDEKTTLQELKDKIRVFCEERDWDKYHNAKELAIGIITESAELLEHFRFKSVTQVDEIFKDKSRKQEISEEMADILYFLLRLAQLYNIDLSSEFSRKMDKNTEKYPISKSKGSNKKYTEF